jgi:hypothetical protein
LQRRVALAMVLGVVMTLQLLPPPTNARSYKALSILALVKALTK